MKFTILAKDLKRALGTCNEIAPASSSIAEHQAGVLINALGESVEFMASDETSYVRLSVPVEVKEPGEALVRCSVATNSITQTFLDDDSPLMVETTNRGTLKVSGASGGPRHNRTFPLLDTGFFVTAPEFEDAKATQMGALAFQDGLLSVAHAASKDASKLHLNCVFVEFTDEEVVFAATDGLQVAEFRKAAEVPKKGPRGSFILGLKFANVVAKHVADVLRAGEGVDVVDLYVDGDNFFLRSGSTILVGTLLNTSFPEYRSYLSTDGKLLALFSKDEFLAVLQSMQATADIKSHRMVVDARTEGSATLFTSSISGEAESSDLKVQTPENFVLNFNSVLLQNAIRPLKEETFEFYFSKEADTVVLKAPKHDDFRTLVCTLKKID